MQLCCDHETRNILVLGLAYLLLFTAYSTITMSEQTIVESFSKEENSTFNASGYIGMAISYASYGFVNWLAPFLVVLWGAKYSMVFGSWIYTLFVASFLIPTIWLFYTLSFTVGCAATVLWTGHGSYLSAISSKETIDRNTGIFWLFFQGSTFIGNIFQYFVFRGDVHITRESSRVFFILLACVALLGNGCFLLLQRPVTKRPRSTSFMASLSSPDTANKFINSEPNDFSPGSTSTDSLVIEPAAEKTTNLSHAWSAITGSISLLKQRTMQLLLFSFFYTGVELSFLFGVVGTCVGHNAQFGTEAKGYIGLVGAMIGLGEMIGGIVFSFKSRSCNRSSVIVVGFVAQMFAFALIWLTLPADSPYSDLTSDTYFHSSLTIILIFGFLLGFGDSAFSTQVISFLAEAYHGTRCASAFAIFNYVQSLAAACAFFYSGYLSLPSQLTILICFAFLAAITFVAKDLWLRSEDDDEERRYIVPVILAGDD